ncbi:MAG: cytochrome c maturation protein CcmE [Alphaproteobacteria bacterium]|nr:cytochrome c maturation protein CcmE [Alphaproteobacteria bacterium]
MRPKRRRLWAVVAGLGALGAAAALVLAAFEDNIVFFRSPSEVASNSLPTERRFRLGGLVETGSLRKAGDGVTVTFRVTDLAHAVPVSYRGLLPDLFREGQGVVAEGQLDANGIFQASQILAKHDETYMPREVAEALRKGGHWKGEGEGQ